MRSVANEGLPLLIDDPNARQALHVTYGSVMSDRGLGPAIYEAIAASGDAYEQGLAALFEKHLAPLGQID